MDFSEYVTEAKSSYIFKLMLVYIGAYCVVKKSSNNKRYLHVMLIYLGMAWEAHSSHHCQTRQQTELLQN